MSLSDRILVMNNGQIVGELTRKDADETALGLMMAGISAEEKDARSAKGVAS